MLHDDFPEIDPDVELGGLDQQLAWFREDLAWMEAYTSLHRDGRWRRYERIMESQADKGRGLEMISQVADEAHAARNAFYEAYQLRVIRRAFRDADGSVIAGKLRVMAKGHPHYSDDPDGFKARDAAFELFFAANLIESGLRVRLGDDLTRLEDMLVELDDYDLFIECKRPRRDKSAVRCAKEAFDQLRTRIAGASRPAFGAVAFAVEAARNPEGDYIRTSGSATIPDALTSRNLDFIAHHRNLWLSNRPRGVIMSMVHLSGAAYVGERATTVASAAVTIEPLLSPSDDDWSEGRRAIQHIYTTLGVMPA